MSYTDRVVVTVAAPVWRYLKKHARAFYPNEMEAYLFGHLHNGGKQIEILGTYVPTGDEVVKSTPESVQLSGQSQIAARAIALETKMTLLGTVHTHPDQYGSAEGEQWDYYTDAAPSLQDFEGSWEEHVMGIFHIRKSKSGRWKYNLRFFNPKGLYVTAFDD